MWKNRKASPHTYISIFKYIASLLHEQVIRIHWYR